MEILATTGNTSDNWMGFGLKRMETWDKRIIVRLGRQYYEVLQGPRMGLSVKPLPVDFSINELVLQIKSLKESS